MKRRSITFMLKSILAFLKGNTCAKLLVLAHCLNAKLDQLLLNMLLITAKLKITKITHLYMECHFLRVIHHRAFY